MINFAEHFAIQDRLNCVINPDWRNAGYRWSDAAMVEAVEAFDHLAWKWWKAGTDNMPQFRLELVDIYHFVLSDCIVVVPEDARMHVMNYALSQRDLYAKSGSLRDMLRLFIAACAEGNIPPGAFFRLCELADLSLGELDRLYRAKGVLNLFRQANGYKEGTYIKMWDGHEDNHWLQCEMDVNPDATADQLMDELSKIYHAVTSSPVPTGHPVGNYDVDGRRFRWDGTYLYAYDVDDERLATIAECDRWEKTGRPVPTAAAAYRPSHGGRPSTNGFQDALGRPRCYTCNSVVATECTECDWCRPRSPL